MSTLSDKILYVEEMSYTTTEQEIDTVDSVLFLLEVQEKLKEERESLKVLFCMNPDIEYCNECWACKGIDNIHKEKFGEKVTNG